MDEFDLKYRESLYQDWISTQVHQPSIKDVFNYAYNCGLGLNKTEAGPVPVNMEWVLVECIQSYRMRYMVEVPEGRSEWALDTVAMQQAKEFSQESIGETIISHRVISEEDALKLCDEDNDYAKSWTPHHKITSFFTKDGEKRYDE